MNVADQLFLSAVVSDRGRMVMAGNALQLQPPETTPNMTPQNLSRFLQPLPKKEP